MAEPNPVLYYGALALAAAGGLLYLWWGATRDAFLDMGLLPTVTVFILLGLLGAYAAKLEAEKAEAEEAERSGRGGGGRGGGRRGRSSR